METEIVIIIAIVASAIWLWILYEVIKSATKSTKQTQFLEIQTRLLVELLRKQGASDESLLEITNLRNKYSVKKS